jgi:hypothetical protein
MAQKKGLDRKYKLDNPKSKWKKQKKQHPYMDPNFQFDCRTNKPKE